jgi:hypothetical protein
MKRGHWIAVGVISMCIALPSEAQLRPREQQRQQGAVPTNVTPPKPTGNVDRPPTIWLIAVAVLLGAGIVGTAVIPSKRGHQD